MALPVNTSPISVNASPIISTKQPKEIANGIVVINKVETNLSEDECPICLEFFDCRKDLKNRNSLVVQHPCNHIMHEDCYNQSDSKENKECCYCRSYIDNIKIYSNAEDLISAYSKDTTVNGDSQKHSKNDLHSSNAPLEPSHTVNNIKSIEDGSHKTDITQISNIEPTITKNSIVLNRSDTTYNNSQIKQILDKEQFSLLFKLSDNPEYFKVLVGECITANIITETDRKLICDKKTVFDQTDVFINIIVQYSKDVSFLRKLSCLIVELIDKGMISTEDEIQYSETLQGATASIITNDSYLEELYKTGAKDWDAIKQNSEIEQKPIELDVGNITYQQPGAKKILWTNMDHICTKLEREPGYLKLLIHECCRQSMLSKFAEEELLQCTDVFLQAKNFIYIISFRILAGPSFLIKELMDKNIISLAQVNKALSKHSMQQKSQLSTTTRKIFRSTTVNQVIDLATINLPSEIKYDSIQAKTILNDNKENITRYFQKNPRYFKGLIIACGLEILNTRSIADIHRVNKLSDQIQMFFNEVCVHCNPSPIVEELISKNIIAVDSSFLDKPNIRLNLTDNTFTTEKSKEILLRNNANINLNFTKNRMYFKTLVELCTHHNFITPREQKNIFDFRRAEVQIDKFIEIITKKQNNLSPIVAELMKKQVIPLESTTTVPYQRLILENSTFAAEEAKLILQEQKENIINQLKNYPEYFKSLVQDCKINRFISQDNLGNIFMRRNIVDQIREFFRILSLQDKNITPIIMNLFNVSSTL